MTNHNKEADSDNEVAVTDNDDDDDDDIADMTLCMFCSKRQENRAVIL